MDIKYQWFFTNETKNLELKKKSPYLEVPDKGRYAAVGLVVVLLMGKLLQLGQERNRIPRREQGQQVRG